MYTSTYRSLFSDYDFNNKTQIKILKLNKQYHNLLCYFSKVTEIKILLHHKTTFCIFFNYIIKNLLFNVYLNLANILKIQLKVIFICV